jgi:hypothetical protein
MVHLPSMFDVVMVSNFIACIITYLQYSNMKNGGIADVRDEYRIDGSEREIKMIQRMMNTEE